ncbi:hypothetical protein JX265_004500 [Neoarthrinium moseri]|uniref:YCII-related domain-containing protein n=1 Tax=Neoarthrinium moseri TaxID=1658444 RepID=A0A9Q0ASZ3_9PEZI|nr:uncharacterized protein JN550_008180 [Neoarthrinium moseri]KAI1865922.1 hypothetical protein JN550_008180 [Neoarthrinium moseri]KAI1875442.1 hypothetical protein JX265_004500 [Neoarthrinium moseri]
MATPRLLVPFSSSRQISRTTLARTAAASRALLSPVSRPCPAPPQPRRPLLQARAMASSSSSSSDPARPAISTPPAGKYEFLAVVPDKPGSQPKRLEVRAKHFEGLQPFIDSGFYKAGGAALKDRPEGTDATKWDFYGSTMIMVAESVDECREILRKDIYSKSGVWDVDNAQIWPVKFAFRYP